MGRGLGDRPSPKFTMPDTDAMMADRNHGWSAMTPLRTGWWLSAILLVYLLMVVNFQSCLDPLIILMALPGALAGIVWILFLTGTTLSVHALIGAIMCVGVATANSILVV